MTTSTPTSATNVPILTTANYSLWAPAMEDYLRAKGMWYWIHRSPPDERTDPKGNRKCLESQDQAVGEIRHHLSPELRSVALASSDPQSILDAIKAAYGASSFATRHNVLKVTEADRLRRRESGWRFCLSYGYLYTCSRQREEIERVHERVIRIKKGY